jgi:hypothetical protein
MKNTIRMSRHLNAAAGLVMSALFGLYACQSNPVVPALPPDHVALISKESVTALDAITVTADSVNVSVCPANANCFAPNSTSVKLQLSKNAQSRTVRLWAFIPNYTRRTSPNAPIDSVSVEFGGQQYKVILRDGGFRKGAENVDLPEAVVQVSRL